MATPTNQQPRDAGSAMIITLMVMALLAALSTTVAAVTINNLQSSTRAQQAGSALNAADAGVSQAVSYLRSSGVRDLRCSPSCPSNPWGSQTNPSSVSMAGGQRYAVWIETVTPFPANDPGLYRVHSTGTAGGSAERRVLADVTVTSASVPKGIFARTISGGGSASVTRQSVFSTGCVYDRSKINMQGGTDVAYGIPVAVHSAQIITESNGTGQYCPTTQKPIHDPKKTGAARYCPTDPRYRFDQDKLGGPLSSADSCYDSRMASGGAWASYYAPRNLDADSDMDVNGSYIKDDATLQKLFGVQSPVLSQAQIDRLRSVAQAQGTFYETAAPPAPTNTFAPSSNNAVMFFDLKGAHLGETVDLNKITGFERDPNVLDSDPTCTSKSLVIVIEGGNARLNSTTKLFASLFLTSTAPYGQVVKDNGNSAFIGTIYADNVNMVGTADISMDTCFLANVSPALLDFTLKNYREDDR